MESKSWFPIKVMVRFEFSGMVWSRQNMREDRWTWRPLWDALPPFHHQCSQKIILESAMKLYISGWKIFDLRSPQNIDQCKCSPLSVRWNGRLSWLTPESLKTPSIEIVIAIAINMAIILLSSIVIKFFEYSNIESISNDNYNGQCPSTWMVENMSKHLFLSPSLSR